MSTNKKSTRKAFGESLVFMGEKYSQVVALDADLSKSTMSFAFSQQFPERFFQMGIAESNMIGVASGLALSGFIPFACSFACFITGRFDQIKMSVAYQGAKVRLVGTHAGVGIGEDGYSQQGLEDLALMRSLPSMEVFQPGDDIETMGIMEYLCQSTNPAYIRLTRQDLHRVHKENHSFSKGVFPMLKPGKGVAIFASGGPLYAALEAALELKNNGLDPWVFNGSSLKPVDKEAIIKMAQSCRLLVTVEDHNIIGGLASAVSEVIATVKHDSTLLKIGINDEFGESGTPSALYDKHGFTKEKIQASVLRQYQIVS